MEKFDLEPLIQVRCPFCKRKHIRDALEHIMEIDCECGAFIRFGMEFEWGSAFMDDDKI